MLVPAFGVAINGYVGLRFRSIGDNEQLRGGNTYFFVDFRGHTPQTCSHMGVPKMPRAPRFRSPQQRP